MVTEKSVLPKLVGQRGTPYWGRMVWLVAGPLAWLLITQIRPSGELTLAGVKVAAVAAWLIIWWVGSPVAMPVTSLLPLCLFPLSGVSTLAQTSASYANPIVYLFFGGFIIALAIERHDMHRRLAWGVLLILGSNTRLMLLGLMIASGFISMWISNMATTIMMLPIALAVIGQLPELLSLNMPREKAEEISQRVARALLLGIAFAASIGGMGTLVGCASNAILAGAMRAQFQVELSFSKWLLVGLPVTVVGLIGSYFVLVTINKIPALSTPGIQKLIAQRFKELGPITGNQITVTAAFVLVSMAWITRDFLIKPFLPKVDDATIAMIGAVLLFILPQQHKDRRVLTFILDWKDMQQLPWGLLLLFGGGFSLASAFETSKLSLWIGSQLSLLQNVPLIGLLFAVVLLVSLMTQVTSNTATATIMMPILGSLGRALGVEPLLLMASAALASSCAFMLPVGTPPNAIVFSSGHISVRDMIASGIWINLGFVLVLTLAARFLMVYLL